MQRSYFAQDAFELFISHVEFIVQDDVIVHARLLAELHRFFRLLEPLFDRTLTVGLSTPQALLEDLETRRTDVNIQWIQIGLSNVFDALFVNVQETYAACTGYVFDGLFAREENEPLETFACP